MDGFNFDNYSHNYQSCVIDEEKIDNKIVVSAKDSYRAEPGGPPFMLTMIANSHNNLARLNFTAKGGKGANGANGGCKNTGQATNGGKRGKGGIFIEKPVIIYDLTYKFQSS